MNRTLKISLARMAFVIDEQAYKILENYLNTLEKCFSGKESGKEILEEIEQRIAEILSEKCPNSQVITTPMVNEVISTLGSASEIETDAKEEKEMGQKPKTKRLFRDKTNKVIAGVCSGLAAYWNVDVTIVRLILVLVTVAISALGHGMPLGFFVLVYVAMWVCIPEAKTVQDRYQMRGEGNTIDSISHQIEKGAKQFGKDAKEFARKNNGFFHTLLRAFCIIIGVCFFLSGAVSLITILLCLLGVFPLPFALLGALSGVIGVGSSIVTYISFVLVITLPLLILLYLGILLTFNMNSPRWKPGLWIILLWLVSVLILGISCIGTVLPYNNPRELHRDNSFPIENATSLKIVMEGADNEYDYVLYDGDYEDYYLVMLSDKNLYVYPKINIHYSSVLSDEFNVREDKMLFDRKEGRNREFFDYDNGVLTIKPTVFNRYKGLNEIGTEIDITLPSDCNVSLIGPENHDFKSYTNYSNFFPFNQYHLLRWHRY